MTLASARWAAVGDTIARLLEATGSEVTREYYFNDHGAQIDRFSRSLLAQCPRASRRPEDGYPGEYIAEIADRGRRGATRTRPTWTTAPRSRSIGPRASD